MKKNKINFVINIISYVLILIFFILMMYHTISFPDGSEENMFADTYLILIILVFIIKFILNKIVKKYSK